MWLSSIDVAKMPAVFIDGYRLLGATRPTYKIEDQLLALDPDLYASNLLHYTYRGS